jgi:GAF domain-containing protein
MTAQGWQIPLSRERSLVARAARTRQGIIVNDVRAEPDFMPNPLLPETRAEMAIPLIAGEKVLGVVDVQSEQVDHFTQEDVNIQTALASQIAISLQNARQHHETQVALSKTETLYAITRSATRSLDLDEVLREMLNKTLSATGLEAGLISIVDASTERLYLAVHHNLPEPLVRKLSTVGLDGTLCDMVYRKEATISLQDMSSDAPLDVTGLLKLGLLSYQGVPLVAKGKVLGTLCAFGFSPRADLHETVELMEIAGQQIGIAIENAQLFQQIQRQAEHEARINAISQKIQTTTSVEDALQVAIRELGRALNAQKTVVQLGVAGYEIAPPKPNGSRSNGN